MFIYVIYSDMLFLWVLFELTGSEVIEGRDRK